LENAVHLRHATPLVALAAAAGLAAGCGGSGSGSGQSNAARSGGSQQPSAAAKPSATAKPKAAANPSTGSVTISNFKFAPASVTVSKGTRVTVANHDTTAHTATADDGHSFDTGNIDPNQSATITLSKSGTYKFHCNIHPFMHGTLVVR
jgi:plastocyanin